MKWSGPLVSTMPSNRNIGSWPARWNVPGKRSWHLNNNLRRSIIALSSASHACFRKPSERRFAAWQRTFPHSGALQLPRQPIGRRSFARSLNGAGCRPPRSTTGFRAEMITQLQRQLGMKAPRPRVRHHEGFLPHEWWPTELARHLHIPRGTLLHWIRQGVVRARQLDEPLHRWVVWADEAEQERLQAYHQRV